MSLPEKKVLLFIKNASHNMKAVETFLNKRNFTVHTETDAKDALEKIIELQPDFIFLAWDHLNTKVTALPKLIHQASLAPIIPYISSFTKEDTRKLDMSGLATKLYPPLSGPAIERLILKSNKQLSEEEAKFSPTHTKAKEASDIVRIKSNLITDFNNSAVTAEASSLQNEKQSEMMHLTNQKKLQNIITGRNQFLTQVKKESFSQNTKEQLKNSFLNKILTPLSSILTDLDEAQITERNDLIIEKGIGNTNNLGLAIETGISNPHGLGTQIEKGLATTKLSLQQNTLNEKVLNAFCMSVYSEAWCGYLIITTNASLDFSTIDLIFTDWIKLQLGTLQEIDEHDVCKINNVDFKFIENVSKNAEFHESTQINNYDLMVSFFPVNPSKMLIELTEDNILIKIPTEKISANKMLSFSLHLHLPENKKYLTYTQTNGILSLEQKNRLISNGVQIMYTPIEFENEYKRFLVENNINEIYTELNKQR